MNALGLVLAGAALVGIGIGVGAHLVGRRQHHPRDLEQIAYLAGELDDAEQVINDLTHARLWEAERQTPDGWPTAPVPVPPGKWATLQEARENWETN